MVRRALVFSVCTLGMFAITGCGSGSRSSVEGTVTFDGQSVDGGSITFLPESGDKNASPASGQIIDGKYAIDSERGPAPGKYKVEIIWKKKTGKQIPNASDPGTSVDETKQVIPQKYNSKTELTCEIKSGSNKNVNFELKPGGPVDSGLSPSSGGRTKAAGD